ncbi:MAG: hypothetical protein WB780_21850 [Candidatus Acidiferrales bacterium]
MVSAEAAGSAIAAASAEVIGPTLAFGATTFAESVGFFDAGVVADAAGAGEAAVEDTWVALAWAAASASNSTAARMLVLSPSDGGSAVGLSGADGATGVAVVVAAGGGVETGATVVADCDEDAGELLLAGAEFFVRVLPLLAGSWLLTVVKFLGSG